MEKAGLGLICCILTSQAERRRHSHHMHSSRETFTARIGVTLAQDCRRESTKAHIGLSLAGVLAVLLVWRQGPLMPHSATTLVLMQQRTTVNDPVAVLRTRLKVVVHNNFIDQHQPVPCKTGFPALGVGGRGRMSCSVQTCRSPL